MRIFALAVLLASMVVAVTPAHAETYRWITFKPQGAGDAQARSTQWLVDEFTKRTGGKHKIEVFWGGSVAKTREIPDALGSGVGDFGDIITPYFPDRFPLNNAVGFFVPQPNSVLEIADMMETWHRDIPQFEDELTRANIKVFSYRPLEEYGLLCVKPVRTMEELKGLRIRSYGYAYPSLIEALGASPVSIATAETYEALERGVVDCTPIGVALGRGWRYDEVAKYYIEFPFGAGFGHLLAMNLDTYKKMDPETRGIVEQLGRDYVVTYNQMLEDDIASVRADWEKIGVEVVPFDTGDINALLKDPGIQSVRNDWIERAKDVAVDPAPIVNKFGF